MLYSYLFYKSANPKVRPLQLDRALQALTQRPTDFRELTPHHSTCLIFGSRSTLTNATQWRITPKIVCCSATRLLEQQCECLAHTTKNKQNALRKNPKNRTTVFTCSTRITTLAGRLYEFIKQLKRWYLIEIVCVAVIIATICGMLENIFK